MITTSAKSSLWKLYQKALSLCSPVNLCQKASVIVSWSSEVAHWENNMHTLAAYSATVNYVYIFNKKSYKN